MDSYLVKPRIYMDRDGLTEILQGRKKSIYRYRPVHA